MCISNGIDNTKIQYVKIKYLYHCKLIEFDDGSE